MLIEISTAAGVIGFRLTSEPCRENLAGKIRTVINLLADRQLREVSAVALQSVSTDKS